ncbi:hypothetical protein GIX45_25315 [Erwinia sp. CPCC 100877]|nr:hypothetical protein [Erwinia sp. CPCC 100877]
MKIKFDVLLTETKTTVTFNNNQGTITILNSSDPDLEKAHAAVYLFLKGRTVVALGKSFLKELSKKTTFDKVILITPPWEVEVDYLEQLLAAETSESDLNSADKVNIPANYEKTITEYKEKLLSVLASFGYSFKTEEKITSEKSKPAKARHKWTKEVSQIEFFIDTRESKATVLWIKRNEMLLKAGATMMVQPPLNKDGSLGFAAKMGQRIRADHRDQIKNFITTEDILLKSVNEVGLFLYFGGTNSWLELVDATGKTLDEWTIVS